MDYYRQLCYNKNPMVINKKRFLFIIVLFLFVILSVKPVLFTFNYLMADYYIKVIEDPKYYAKYVLRAIKYKPDSFNYFRKYLIKSALLDDDKDNYITIDKNKKKNDLIKSLIIHNNKSVYNAIGKDKRTNIEFKYQNNLCLQNLLENLDTKRNWEHLDDLSYFFLSNKKYNNLTETIFIKLQYNFSNAFLKNLCDFLYWQGNDSLGDFVKQQFKLNEYIYIKPSKLIGNEISIAKLKKFLNKKFKLKGATSIVNLIEQNGFENIKNFNETWLFTNMANKHPFGDGSFYYNTDLIDLKNTARLHNVYINNKSNSNARGGIWHKKQIKIDRGYYVFSFDYFVKSGKEKLRFWLNKNITEPWLTGKKEHWKKVILVLNNKDGKIDFIKPLIRMFGTGSVWIDNIFFGRLEFIKTKFKKKYYLKNIKMD